MVQDCPLFTILSEDQQRQCKMPTPLAIASEKLAGLIGASLPGGVTIQYGPGPALGNKAPSIAVAAAVATTTTQLPGGVFQEAPTSTGEVNALEVPSSSSSSSSLSSSSSEPAPSPTPTPTPSDAPVPEGYDLVRTDYFTNGNLVSKVVVIETVEYVLMTTETVTVTATFGADKARRELHHLHRHQHAH